MDLPYNCDWRFDCSGISSMQNKARCEARFTDIKFIVGTGKSKKEFSAHKTILAFGSPVFEAMFYGQLAEKRSVIETDDDPEAFEMLLNHLYGKLNTFSSVVSLWKYYIIGDKYLVPKVPDIVKKQLDSTTLTENDFWDIIESDIYLTPIFLEKVTTRIQENTYHFIKSEKFLKVPVTFINSLLKMEKLNIHEYELLFSVTKWCLKNLQEPNTENLKNFYKHIRFSALTSEEFFRFIEFYPEAIDAQSSLRILLHLRNKVVHPLPKWCSSSRIARNRDIQRQHRKVRFLLQTKEAFVYGS